jgi:hypothetical protein
VCRTDLDRQYWALFDELWFLEHPSLGKRRAAGPGVDEDKDHVPVGVVPYPVTRHAQLHKAPQKWMFDPDWLAAHPDLPVVDCNTWLVPEDVKKTDWYLDHPLTLAQASRKGQDQKRGRSQSTDISTGSRSANPQQRTHKKARLEAPVHASIAEEDEEDEEEEPVEDETQDQQIERFNNISQRGQQARPQPKQKTTYPDSIIQETFTNNAGRGYSPAVPAVNRYLPTPREHSPRGESPGSDTGLDLSSNIHPPDGLGGTFGNIDPRFLNGAFDGDTFN